MSDAVAKSLALAALAYKESHDKGDYNEIANKPKLNGVQILGSHNSAYYKLPLLAETGHSLNFVSDSEYNLTIELLNKAGDIISTSSLNLPIESLIMDGRYEEDSEGKGFLILTLENSHEIAIPLEGLIDELATKVYVDSLHTSEMNARILADSELWEALDLETDTRIDADLELQAHIDSERDARELGDSELSNRIDTLTVLLDSEAQIRLEQDTIILNKLDSEAEIRKENDDILADLYTGLFEQHIEDTSELKNLISSEATTRENQFIELQSKLDSEATAREEADLYLEFLIDSEGRTREEQIRAFKVELDSEAIARAQADSELLAKINDKQDKLTVSGPLVLDSEANLSIKYDRDTLILNSEGALEVIGGGATQAYLNGVLLDDEANTESAKIIWYGTESEYNAIDSEDIDPYTMYIVYDAEPDPLVQTASYERLEDKPAINGVTLSGDKTLASFGIQPTMTSGTGLSLTNNQMSVNIAPDGTLGVDTSNRLYVNGYSRAQIDQMIASIFNTSCVAQLPETPTRNTIYFVGNSNPYVTILFDSNGQDHYLGYFNLNAGLPTPTPPQMGDYVCTLESHDGVLSWVYTAK